MRPTQHLVAHGGRGRCPRVAQLGRVVLRADGHLVPGAPVELTPTGLRPDPTVLLVEERDPRLAALIADRPHPAEVERSRTWPGLAAGDHQVQRVLPGQENVHIPPPGPGIPALLDTPAVVRFVSAEPLLGPVRFRFSQCRGA